MSNPEKLTFGEKDQLKKIKEKDLAVIKRKVESTFDNEKNYSIMID